MARQQVCVYMEEGFLALVDEAAGLTGSTRSDFVRRALEHYLREETALLDSLKRLTLLRPAVGSSTP
jgi:metal-responsive CopG/Arc/MetJ family transcriptional regulator